MEIINLNLIPSGVSPICHASQYDVGRQIRFNLLNGNTPYNLASGDVVTLNLRKPDNTIITATVGSTQGNDYVIVTTTQQMTAIEGDTLGELKITNSSNVIGSLNFILCVERDVVSDGVPSESEIRDLDSQVNAIVGNQLYSDKNTLENFNAQNELTGITYPSLNYAGLQMVYDYEKECYTLNGRTTAAINFNIWVNASALPNNIKNGDLLTWKIKRSNSNIVLKRFIQTTSSQSWGGEFWISSHLNENGYYQEIVPANVTGWLLRIYIPSGVSFTNDTISFSVARYLPNVALETASPVIFADNVSASANHDQTTLIQDVLAKYGCVTLGKGTHYVNNLTMPNNSMIKGCGNDTILQTYDSSAHGIIVGAWCSIENICISGTRSAAVSSPTSEAGIYVEGNYESSPLKRNTKISGCFIKGFGAGGIVGKATGYWVADSISAINCEIMNCYAGIRLIDFCEFNRFTNMLCYNNTVGLVCCSGNNVFVNCSFSNNKTGVYLIGDDENLSGNNGHGAIIGSTINHSDNNNGYAIIVRGIKNGFMFEGCNIWYGKILCDVNTADQAVDNAGILISNALIGGGTPQIINWGAQALFLSNCIFKVAPTFTGNQNTIKNNCYMYDGTPVT